MAPRVAVALFSLSLLTAGCNGCASSEVARLVAASHHDEAAGIRFVEILTGGATASETLPLVVVLHGYGGSPKGVLRRTGLASLPERARLIVPYGPDATRYGFSWFPDWANDAELAASSRRMADRLATMIGEVVRLRPTAGKPVVTGVSQGGILTFTLAVLHPEAVRAAFPVAGFLARPLWPSVWPEGPEKPRVHAFHGGADQSAPVGEARDVVRRLSEIGLAAELTEYPGLGHAGSSEERRDLLRAIGREVREP
jgi:phospholipase/carboxylesterase